jgi:hypothetical protein
MSVRENMMGGSDSDSVDDMDAPSLRSAKVLPQAVRRRRPSLSEALTGDGADPAAQHALAMKLASAAAGLAHEDGGAPRYTDRRTAAMEDSGLADPDATHMWLMPSAVALTLILFILAAILQRPITEAVIGRDTDTYLEREAEHEILNEPIGAYVGCVGTIFALMYTSVFNDAQARQSEIRNALAQEAGGVHTAMLLVRTLDADDNINKTRALLLFASYIENLADEIFSKSRKATKHETAVMQASIESLYAAIPFLADIASDGEGDEMDRVLIQRVVDALNRVCEARHRRVSEERHSVSPMTFVFLMMLAIFTFYGVCFLQMGAGGLISSVVAMSGLSLLASMVVLADVAMPWRGFIVVDTAIFVSIRKDISLVLGQEQDATAAGSAVAVVGATGSVGIDQHQHIAAAMASKGAAAASKGAAAANGRHIGRGTGGTRDKTATVPRCIE